MGNSSKKIWFMGMFQQSQSLWSSFFRAMNSWQKYKTTSSPTKNCWFSWSLLKDGLYPPFLMGKSTINGWYSLTSSDPTSEKKEAPRMAETQKRGSRVACQRSLSHCLIMAQLGWCYSTWINPIHFAHTSDQLGSSYHSSDSTAGHPASSPFSALSFSKTTSTWSTGIWITRTDVPWFSYHSPVV